MKITLIRHTSLAIHPSFCYGQSDVDVSDNFEFERLALQAKLSKYQFNAIYASPLQRCHKLAQALCIDAKLGFHVDEIQLDARLKELHFGDWEMLSWDDIPRDKFDVWMQDYANLAPPNGETFNALQSRGLAFLNEIQAIHPKGHIAVVSHGGMIRALLAHALNIPLKSLFRLNIDYASVTTLDFCNDIPKILYVNH